MTYNLFTFTISYNYTSRSYFVCQIAIHCLEIIWNSDHKYINLIKSFWIFSTGIHCNSVFKKPNWSSEIPKFITSYAEVSGCLKTMQLLPKGLTNQICKLTNQFNKIWAIAWFSRFDSLVIRTRLTSSNLKSTVHNS